MKRIEFAALCGELLIDPAVALENENVKQALRERRDKDLRNILESEF